MASVPPAPAADVATVVVHRGFSLASVNGADRVRQLRLAGHLLHAGRLPDVGWLAAQLWDLADLVASQPGLRQKDPGWDW